jgi:hypothetical protein
VGIMAGLGIIDQDCMVARAKIMRSIHLLAAVPQSHGSAA